MNDPERNAPMDPEPIPVEEKRTESSFCGKTRVARLSCTSIVVIIVAVYAVLFGILGACQAPSYAYDILLLALFFTILGYDQIQPLATFKAFRKMFFPVLPDTD
ncbi:MAG: hypothetical protein ACLQNE_00135 [Thermoguttaceae bacterium]|jgi:hypothetical protein